MTSSLKYPHAKELYFCACRKENPTRYSLFGHIFIDHPDWDLRKLVLPQLAQALSAIKEEMP